MDNMYEALRDEQKRIEDFKLAAGTAIPDSMINYLQKRGYFFKPAAKEHHGAKIGGLFEHSMMVAQELCTLTVKLGLQWERKISPIIVGLLHDICKLNEYTITIESRDGYTIDYDKEKPYPGHGEASALMALQLALQSGEMILTEEEIMCIRYHMGAFTDRQQWEYYTKAVKKYPNVLWTHTADMVASQVKGV